MSLTLLAQPLNDDTVSPGLLGTAVFALLCVATFFLIRSMNKQMHKIKAPRQADLDQRAWERAQAGQADQAAGGGETGEPGGTAEPADNVKER